MNHVVRRATRRVFLAMFLMLNATYLAPAGASKEIVQRLRNEPLNMFDFALFRLQNEFFMRQEYEKDWFKRQHKGISFNLDMVFFWPSRSLIVIHRDIRARANLTNCTIAIETLRENLTLARGVDGFINQYFWHYASESPTWLRSLPQSILLVGSVYEAASSPAAASFFHCESRLDEKEVRIMKERPVYR